MYRQVVVAVPHVLYMGRNDNIQVAAMADLVLIPDISHASHMAFVYRRCNETYSNRKNCCGVCCVWRQHCNVDRRSGCLAPILPPLRKRDIWRTMICYDLRRNVANSTWSPTKDQAILLARTTTTAASIMAETSLSVAVAFTEPTSLERKKSAAKIMGR